MKPTRDTATDASMSAHVGMGTKVVTAPPTTGPTTKLKRLGNVDKS